MSAFATIFLVIVGVMIAACGLITIAVMRADHSGLPNTDGIAQMRGDYYHED